MAKIIKFYFSHDIRAAEDVKMLKLLNKCNAVGYGIYWGIIELLHDSPEIEMTELIETLNLKKFGEINDITAVIDDCITFNLLHRNNDNKIYCNRVYENINKMDERKKTSAKGGITTQENIRKLKNNSN